MLREVMGRYPHSFFLTSYLQLQGGVGSMGTKDVKATDTPYNSDRLGGGATRGSMGYMWDFCQWRVGVELGFAIYSHNRYNSAVSKLIYDGYNTDLLAVGRYYFNDYWYLVGKLGPVYLHQYMMAITQHYLWGRRNCPGTDLARLGI